MFFDKALWSALLGFAANFRPGARVSLVDRRMPGHIARGEPSQSDELSIETYIAMRADEVEPEPAEYVMVRDDTALVLCIATEFWTQVGGPTPYADSYTYSIFSAEDVSGRVMTHLSAADGCGGWRLASEVLQAPQTMRRY
jgi:hypothetical protein